MRQAIQSILSTIRKGCLFDSHFVIARLIKQNSDVYLRFAGSIRAQSRPTAKVNGKIAQEIARFEKSGLIVRERQYKSWSESIGGKANSCTCWRKL